MQKQLLFICFAFFSFAFARADNIDVLLKELDKVVRMRDVYAAKREGSLEEIKRSITTSTSDAEKYKIYSRLFDEYRSFQSDTAIVYANKKFDIATKLNEEAKLDDSRLNMAEIYSIIGLYKEALDILDDIDRHRLNKALIGYSYHIYCTVYQYMSDFSVTDDQKENYKRQLNIYCDSLVNIENPGTNGYIFAKANYLMSMRENAKARDLLQKYYIDQDVDGRDISVYAYLIALTCELEKDRSEEKKYLAISAISDLKYGIKEYISLRRLAYLLYQDGDIDRAYTYMKASMDDAMFCNSHMRMMEVSQILPIINNDYQNKTLEQKRQLFTLLSLISLLSLLLLVGLIYIYKQMQRVRTARHKLKDANNELKATNDKLEQTSQQLINHIDELEQLNKEMSLMNETLSESNCIKETYIVRYMDLCSEYIDKMEIYLNRIKKMSVSGDIKTLNNMLNPAQYINESLDLFYNNFDTTFLHLFPTFVEDFNKLLKSDNQIDLKEGELLNTELRIYALIRLGITDSVKISRFLRYSLSTIYNYRTQARNKAVVERAEFERKVMEIGLENY